MSDQPGTRRSLRIEERAKLAEQAAKQLSTQPPKEKKGQQTREGEKTAKQATQATQTKQAIQTTQTEENKQTSKLAPEPNPTEQTEQTNPTKIPLELKSETRPLSLPVTLSAAVAGVVLCLKFVYVETTETTNVTWVAFIQSLQTTVPSINDQFQRADGRAVKLISIEGNIVCIPGLFQLFRKYHHKYADSTIELGGGEIQLFDITQGTKLIELFKSFGIKQPYLVPTPQHDPDHNPLLQSANQIVTLLFPARDDSSFVASPQVIANIPASFPFKMSLEPQLNLVVFPHIRSFYSPEHLDQTEGCWPDTFYSFDAKLEKKRGRGIPAAGPRPSVIVTKVGKLVDLNEIAEIETHGKRSTTRRFGSKASLINLSNISWAQTPDATILEFLYHWTWAFHLTPLDSTISTTIVNTLEPSSKDFLEQILTSSLPRKPRLKEWSDEFRPQLFNLLAAGSTSILGDFFYNILVTIHQQFSQLNVIHGVNPHTSLPQLAQYLPNHNYHTIELKATRRLDILEKVDPATCATESQYQTGLGLHVLSSLADPTNTATKQQIEGVSQRPPPHHLDSNRLASIEKITTMIQDLKKQRKRIQLRKNEMKSRPRRQSLKHTRFLFGSKLPIDQHCELYPATCMSNCWFLKSIIRNQDNLFTLRDINKAKDLLQNIQNTEIQQYIANQKSIKSIRTYQCLNGVRRLFQEKKILSILVRKLLREVRVSIRNAHKRRNQQRKAKIQPWADSYLQNHKYTILEINTIGKITVLKQISLAHIRKEIRTTRHSSRPGDILLSKTRVKPTPGLSKLELDWARIQTACQKRISILRTKNSQHYRGQEIKKALAKQVRNKSNEFLGKRGEEAWTGD